MTYILHMLILCFGPTSILHYVVCMYMNRSVMKGMYMS